MFPLKIIPLLMCVKCIHYSKSTYCYNLKFDHHLQQSHPGPVDPKPAKRLLLFSSSLPPSFPSSFLSADHNPRWLPPISRLCSSQGCVFCNDVAQHWRYAQQASCPNYGIGLLCFIAACLEVFVAKTPNKCLHAGPSAWYSVTTAFSTSSE